MNAIPSLTEKSAGAIISFAIGDALGWPNEFRSENTSYNKNYISQFKEWKKRAGGRYWSHTEIIAPGEYSDDTQLMLSVARSLLSGKNWNEYFKTYELPFWKKYERGGGSAVLRAASLWDKKIAPWRDKEKMKYFYAGGNGAAMRILPHVIFNLSTDGFKNIYNDVVENAITTHGHPRAVIGALCYAYALYYSLKKDKTLSYGELISEVLINHEEWGRFPENLDTEWLDFANKFYNYEKEWYNSLEINLENLKTIKEAVLLGLLDTETETLKSIQAFNKKVNGAGDIAAVSAIYFASKYANNPALGIKQAANSFGMDTDTIAAMTGGLLGALCGVDWIPYDWKIVQDYDALQLISECLSSSNGQKILQEHISNVNAEYEWIRLSIGKARKESEMVIQCGKTGEVFIEKYITALGQTLYIKAYSRTETSAKKSGTETIKINDTKLKSTIIEDTNCNISLLTLLDIHDLKNQGKSVHEISKTLNIDEEIVKKILVTLK